MKKLLSLFILIFAFNSFAQESAKTGKGLQELKAQTKQFDSGKRYLIAYDKFEDQTAVRCFGFNLIGTGASFAEALSKSMSGAARNSTLSSFYLGSGFVFKGDTLKETVQDYYIYFYYTGDEWKFLRNSKLIVLADEERIQFGDGEAVRDVGRGAVSEIIGFKATKEVLEKLSKSKSVEIKIGSYIKKLKPEYMEMFGNIAKLGDVSQKAEAKK